MTSNNDSWPGSVSDKNTTGGLSPDNFVEARVARVLIVWVLPVIIILGSLGNVTAFVVLMRERMRHTSVNLYLVILACADTGVLYFSGFKTWISAVAHWEMLTLSNSSCKIVTFLFLLSLHLSAWCVVAISVDRFVAVWLPFKSLTLCNIRKAAIVSLIGCMVLILYNSHIFWTIHLVENKYGVQCVPVEGNFFMSKVFGWVKLATYSGIPFAIVFVLNICIIVKILHRSYSNASSENNLRFPRNSYQSHRNGWATTMLLVVSVSWLLLTTPSMLWRFAAQETTDAHERVKNRLARVVCFILMYLNHAINFYIYCLTGRNFRLELMDALTCRPQDFRIRTGSIGTGASNTRRANSRPSEEFHLVDNHRSSANHHA